MTKINYSTLKAKLEHPTPWTFPTARLIENLHKHSAPEDPEFQVPEEYQPTDYGLYAGNAILFIPPVVLEKPQRAFCTLIACEDVLERARAQDRIQKQYEDAFCYAIESAREHLDGEKDSVADARVGLGLLQLSDSDPMIQVNDRVNTDLQVAFENMLITVDFAYDSEEDTYRDSRQALAAAQRVDAYLTGRFVNKHGQDYFDNHSWLEQVWEKCRSRLAFSDAPNAELERVIYES